MRDLARRTFGGLKRDVARESFRDDHVHDALADVVPFDKADIVEERKIALAQDLPGLAHLLEAFHLLNADVQQADGRPLAPEQDARHRRAHHRKIDEMCRVGADAGAQVEHNRFATHRRPARRNRGPVDPGQGLELEFCQRHERTGVAGGHGKVGLPAFHRVDRHRHRGLPAPLPQRLALELRPRVDQRLDQGAVPEQEEFNARVPVERTLRAGDDHGRTMVAPHGVERDTNLIRHRRP